MPVFGAGIRGSGRCERPRTSARSHATTLPWVPDGRCTEMKTIVADETEVPALGEWDGPLFGELGVLSRDGTRLECHRCARWYPRQASHVC